MFEIDDPNHPAPKDGTQILLFCVKDGHVLWACACSWETAFPGFIHCASYSGWFHNLPLTRDPTKGRREQAAYGDLIGNSYPPTHWMPIPEV